MRNNGSLALTADRLLVWSSRVRTACPAGAGKSVVVDLSDQRARMCRSGQQKRTTLVTTGASALGYGTPTGSWRVYARVRDTTLYPAAGGAYPVDYWMPYSGPYGLHDSPWQHFPYGSPLYTTRGSHGCVHVPARMMAWLFDWAAVGTRVTVRA
jgi:lipoprotein-anchoring transpeptidase ErfK/SrfK